jgi:hypothetical protein
MNTQLKTANSIVIAHFSTTKPATTRLNKAASISAASDAKAAKGAARLYNTVLESKGTAVGRAGSLLNATGTAIRRFGMPCASGGYYVPVKSVPEIQNIFDDAAMQLDIIREDILATYDQIIAAAYTNLGEFVKQVSIPTATEAASGFSMRLAIIAQPAALDGPVLSGLTDEIANRVRAESQAQIQDMLRSAHAGPVQDLRGTLAEFCDALRNARRLHMTQFDKLEDEVRRVRELNVLELPEIDALADAASKAAAMRDSVNASDNGSRVQVAVVGESVMQQADATLAALGL